jgi:2'-hydroxyisoflavone reductase
MDILILGGTSFVGRHIAETALNRGHDLSLYTRGQTGPGLFPVARRLIGDRDGGLAALRGGRWDAAIDVNGFLPRLVGDSAAMLANAVDHYTFISTISVFADFSRPGMTEASPLGQLEDESVEEITGETYGPLKALCEGVVADYYPDRSLVVRPGLVAGPYDPTDRFTYWAWRLAGGGEVLAPEGPDIPVQLIDARDLAAWAVSMVESGGTGVFNATGPAYPLTFGEMLETCRGAGDSDVSITWASPAFLGEQGVEGWSDLPLWIPGEEHAGLHRIDCRKAIAAGLAYRPLAETASDTLAWARTRPVDHAWRAGLRPEREAELLGSWRQRAEATT